MQVELFISETGRITCIYKDKTANALKELGEFYIKRACWVEPDFYDPSKWAIVTSALPRTHFGIFNTRAEALKVEEEWVNKQLERPFAY